MGKNLKIVFFVSRNGHFWPFFSPKWHFFAHFVHTKNTGGTPPFWGVSGGVCARAHTSRRAQRECKKNYFFTPKKKYFFLYKIFFSEKKFTYRRSEWANGMLKNKLSYFFGKSVHFVCTVPTRISLDHYKHSGACRKVGDFSFYLI